MPWIKVPFVSGTIISSAFLNGFQDSVIATQTTVDAHTTSITSLNSSVSSLNTTVSGLSTTVAAVPALIQSSLAGAPFSQVLFNSATPGTGATFTYPGGDSTFTAYCSGSWLGAIITIKYSLDGGATWTVLSGPGSSFGFNGSSTVTGLVTNALVETTMQGSPSANIVATLVR